MLKKVQGCILGLATGDALGAPVEFLSMEEILESYGSSGITDLHGWEGFDAGSYTDDTQMALATVRGCLKGSGPYDTDRTSVIQYVYESYLDWLESQKEPFNFRAPGNTCLNSLMSGRLGTIDRKINYSKGCGGVMRTAPVGLIYEPRTAFEMGAAFGAITHGHPSGYLPAGFVSELVAWLVKGNDVEEGIEKSIKTLLDYSGHEETLAAVNLSCELARSDTGTRDAIGMLGEGWVGEEALAVSLFCTLRHPDDWRVGVLASVNHSGDSDSTGAITGAVLGASLGVDAIPDEWLERVEDAGMIRELCGDVIKVRMENRKELWARSISGRVS